MPLSTAEITLDRPEDQLKETLTRLAEHAEVETAGDGRATVRLTAGDCVFSPNPYGLELIASAADEDALATVQRTVGEQLAQATGPEGPAVDWSAPIHARSMRTTDPVAEDYLQLHCTAPDDLLRELVAETRATAGRAAGMQISHDEGAFLAMLVRLTGARFAVEVGVFTGYSSLCIARALEEGGRLLACDVSEEWTSVARRYWERAGVADRIDLRLAPAIETLRALPEDQAIDIAFIDADKLGYRDYYEEIVRRLRPGGLVVLDNVFLGGRVLDPAHQTADPVAMRALNEMIARDERVDAVMLPVRDGVTLARRR